ncbi:MAG: 5-methyltetrahydropteroyltriglutamate--homocysteine S-methyltransferase [Verrucomicrobiota bacterium]
MKTKKPTTHTLGYPRIGEKRELKKATEAYWQGKITRAELEATGRNLRRQNWLTQQAAGIDLIPSNDFSFYDQMLDLTCLVGNVPPRFGWPGGEIDLDTRFVIARGVRPQAAAHAAPCCCGDRQPAATYASEMTKWFDTNYHYIVPEFRADTQFKLSATKIFDEFSEALALGIKTKPILVGPVTYLKLGKVHDPAHPAFNRLDLLPRLLPVYIAVLQKLAALGAEWVQLDEPVFALDLTPEERAALTAAYATLAAASPRLNLLVASYFGGLRDNLHTFLQLPVQALHTDLVREPNELDTLLRVFDGRKQLSLGLVDGRNIWRSDFATLKPMLDKAISLFGPERFLIAPSCSLQHVPVTLRHEEKLTPDLKSWLAFAEEKLAEVSALRELAAGTLVPAVFAANAAAAASRRASPRIHRPEVQARTARITASDFTRRSPFATRQKAQHARLGLPPFPSTTIGSFPQTDAIRAARAKWKKHELSNTDYEQFLEEETRTCVRFQDEIGLDMLVHGEFERNDMVEYFGEQLDGFAFTEHGWVQSYGSRYVKPPIIHGDVARPRPMTVRWSAFAKSLTPHPMKGMLTGPVTLLQWSFVRNDQPRRDTAFQIALALRDEVLDLEKAGIAAIQIDEPALREGLPLRREDRPHYLEWAVNAFRLSAAGVRDDTQIHTHMCYAEFNDIIEAIATLDADVITIESSRSNMELLGAFASFKYPNEIGPGVYDIHSPRVPTVEEMVILMKTAATVLPPANLWVNPDCGLKTRSWSEVKPALTNLVAAARQLRQEVGQR